MLIISVTVYNFTATCLGATISSLEFVRIVKNLAIRSFLSELKSVKMT